MLGARPPLLPLLIAAGACATHAPEPPQILAVEPATGAQGVATAVTIHGAFYLDVRLDFRGERSTIGDTFRATLDDNELTDVVYVDHETVTAVVPASLPPATYTLEVIDPAGRSGTLAAAFTVEATACTPTMPREGPRPLLSCTDLVDNDCNGLTDGEEPTCRPFSAPAVLTAVGTGSVDDDPSLTGDLLELYFNSNRPGGLGGDDIWRITRATIADPWTVPVNVTELNSPALDTTPEVSLDGLTIFIGSDRPGSQGPDIYLSTRPDRGALWSTPARIPGLSSPAIDVAASTTPDLLDVVLESTRGGDADLFVSTRPNTGAPWGMPMPVPELNTPGIERNPSRAGPMGNTLVFDSNRPGGVGDRDLYLTVHPPMGGWLPPLLLDELCSPLEDTDPWMSPDFRYVIFTSMRDGSSRIYEASR